ncbi:MAG: aminoacyl-tRNA hydrolase [Candidatus Doudnabacteria bacterium]|nr:aminoacyl-tRNA hydrolase [Candidatus Doudnabacteria bacterium]
MQLVIALGNPGEKYKQTRHNAGFLALDYILKDLKVISCTSKFDAKICEVHDPEKTFYIYPETYMNASGQAVKKIMDFYKLQPKDVLVLQDEIDLPLGTIKFTQGSGHAGHNGVRSIIDELGTNEFRRIRIGIESRERGGHIPTEAFVLQNFKEDELPKIPFDAIKARVLLELKPKI